MGSCDAAEYLGEVMWDACAEPSDLMLVREPPDVVCLGERWAVVVAGRVIAECEHERIAAFVADAFRAAQQAIVMFDTNGRALV